MARIIRAALAMAGSVAALAGGMTTAHAADTAPLSAAPAAETVVQLQVAGSGKCLDIPGASKADGKRAQQYTCNGTNAQQWRTVPVDKSAFELRSVASGKCLEVRRESTEVRAEVGQWGCKGLKHQRWQFVLVDPVEKLFQLRPTHVKDRCLDIPGGKKDNGVLAQQWYCNQTPAQLWRITPVSPAK
ncbi:hypothetical protein SSP35_03_00230 [Streptomyces sp. NBRC 110611]|uniref:RICIN domain-containing protein n=1 Tax=Streptomyces sp. NBRC 110611 TaxID=1621259 RepID=UPI000835EA26|nr:RICIN domain-containing protein [Streptomyces sp. NBRC 110611]GAU66375.1 hypothetical protein SSP35_03_00230 [Streptomyces sp. NBRC 110611]